MMRKSFVILLTIITVFSTLAVFPSTIVSSGGSGNYPAPGVGDWIISNNTVVGNETIILNGNLTIMPTGSLTFHNVTLKMNCSVNGSYHINVTTGGSFYIYDMDNDNMTSEDASVITSNIPDYQHKYSFWVWKDATLIMKNSELHECGYDGGGEYVNAGISIQSNNVTIDHNLISNNYCGIVNYYGNCTITNNTIKWNNGSGNFGHGIWSFWSSPIIKNNMITENRIGAQIGQSNGLFENNMVYLNDQGLNTGGVDGRLTIRNNSFIQNGDDQIFVSAWGQPTIIGNYLSGGNYGIASTTGPIVTVINTTIENSAIMDISIGPNCHFTVVNCSFNKSKIRFSDTLSEITVQNYLHTYANDTSGIPISNGNIVIKNVMGSPIYSGYTKFDGWNNWTVLTEYYQKDLNADSDGDDPGEKMYHTPHNITATKVGYFDGYAEVNMNESKVVTITLTPLSNFTQFLSIGWNLISIPFEQANISIEQVLSSIDGDYDRVKYYDSLDFMDPWKTYRPGASTNDLSNIDREMGVWIHTTQVCTLIVYGTISSSTAISLNAGWNLVGYPSLTPDTVANALWGTGADRVEVCNLTEPYLIKEVIPTYIMKPGEGYWVHIPADTVWTVDW